jgi:hypothetical protein
MANGTQFFKAPITKQEAIEIAQGLGGSGGGSSGTKLGTWNASTNTPTLPNPPTSPDFEAGDYYVVSAAGTQFSIDWTVNDKIIATQDGANLIWTKEEAGVVDTVNSIAPDATGNVSLTQDDVPDGTTYKQYNPADVSIEGGSGTFDTLRIKKTGGDFSLSAGDNAENRDLSFAFVGEATTDEVEQIIATSSPIIAKSSVLSSDPTATNDLSKGYYNANSLVINSTTDEVFINKSSTIDNATWISLTSQLKTAELKTANFTAEANKVYGVDASGGDIEITLPTATSNKSIVIIRGDDSDNSVDITGSVSLKGREGIFLKGVNGVWIPVSNYLASDDFGYSLLKSESSDAVKSLLGLPKSNLTATTDPTVNDGVGEGFQIGSDWFNSDNGKYFLLKDPALGAAVWVDVSNNLVKEATVDDFPITGDVNYLYLATSTNQFYNWNGSNYIQVSASSTASFLIRSSDDVDNNYSLNLQAASNEVIINSSSTGTGTTKDLLIKFDGVEKAKIDKTGIISSQALTANSIVATSASKQLFTPSQATYPNLTEVSYVKGVTSSIQDQIDGKQDEDNLLTSISNLGGNGIIVRQNGNDAETREIVAGSNKVVVSNGDGVSSNPSIDVAPENIPTGGEVSGNLDDIAILNSAVLAKVLTGLNVSGGSLAATDSIIEAFGKVQNQINGVLGGAIYQGTWNASTNTPTLSDATGVKGHYYVISVAGTQDLGDGDIEFAVGDWAIHNGTKYDKVDNTDAVVSVNGLIGAVVLDTGDVAENGNLYFTAARAIASALTGYTKGAGTVAATDTILEAIQKLDGNLDAKQSTSEKGAANGYASLDGATKVPYSQIPTGLSAGSVAAADNPLLVGALQKNDNLASLQSASTARTNLGLGSLATLNSVGEANITNSSVTFAKIQNVSPNSFVANPTGSNAAPQNVSGADAALLLPSISAGATGKGVFTQPASGQGAYYPLGNNTWQSPADALNAIYSQATALTEKGAPVGADIITILDSEASFALKKVQVSSLDFGRLTYNCAAIFNMATGTVKSLDNLDSVTFPISAHFQLNKAAGFGNNIFIVAGPPTIAYGYTSGGAINIWSTVAATSGLDGATAIRFDVVASAVAGYNSSYTQIAVYNLN